MDVFEEEIYEVIHVIKGECHGVVLSLRGEGDPHIVFRSIIEDDENWFINKAGSSSSFWLQDHIDVMKKAKKWLKKNCVESHGGFGWSIRDGL